MRLYLSSFAKVDKDYSSQICPRCDTYTGKKSLDVRIHHCDNCGYTLLS
ncbi:MAG: zinc ribbon domain-containing protein [Xenococcaceae cyanobacterium MO_207.B15]|nr:zinc ribbon domain-containing protein [Xenococcaceae cyanobacterium MO_207.B15]